MPLSFGSQAWLDGRGARGITKVRSLLSGLASLSPLRPSQGHKLSWSQGHTWTPGHTQCGAVLTIHHQEALLLPGQRKPRGRFWSPTPICVLTRVGIRTSRELFPFLHLSLLKLFVLKKHTNPPGSFNNYGTRLTLCYHALPGGLYKNTDAWHRPQGGVGLSVKAYYEPSTDSWTPQVTEYGSPDITTPGSQDLDPAYPC